MWERERETETEAEAERGDNAGWHNSHHVAQTALKVVSACFSNLNWDCLCVSHFLSIYFLLHINK